MFPRRFCLFVGLFLLVCVVVCFIIAYLFYILFGVRLWSKIGNYNSDTCIVKGKKTNSIGKFRNETITNFNSIIQTIMSPHYFRDDFFPQLFNWFQIFSSEKIWSCRILSEQVKMKIVSVFFPLIFIYFIF